MTAHTTAPASTPGDIRRATALLRHHLAHDVTGLAVVLVEAEREQRLVPLVTALLTILDGLGVRATDQGIAVLDALARDAASREEAAS